MKTFSFLLALLFVGTISFAQIESDKTLIKTLNPEDCPNVKIDIQNKGIVSAPWDHGTIRVELEIKANIPEAILAQLIKAGRYSIDGGKDGEVYIVSAPNLAKTIMVGGKNLEEVINIKVQTPGYFALNDGMLSKDIDENAFAARNGMSTEEAAVAMKKMKAIREDMSMHVNIISTSSYKGEVNLSEYKLTIDGKEVTADQIDFSTTED